MQQAETVYSMYQLWTLRRSMSGTVDPIQTCKVLQIMEYAEEFEKWHGLECVECGSCSFVMSGKTSVGTVYQDHEKTGSCSKRKK